MSAVRSSIENLHNAIMRLDSALTDLEENRKGEQRDMFAAPASNENGSDDNSADNSVIAKRLDNAIEKVEQLLKDGSNG